MRLRNIDWVKGLLVVLVILGHMLQGKMNESVWRTLIYSFHMPLFIGVSGFLFNAASVTGLSIVQLLDKYKFRVIVPWLIAVAGYFLFFNLRGGTLYLTELLNWLISPYYHLWFIPGFLSWVCITWCIQKFKPGHNTLLLVAAIISITAELLNTYPHLYQGRATIGPFINWVLHTFRPNYYFFFALGMWHKNTPLQLPRPVEYAIPVVFVLSTIVLFYRPHMLVTVGLSFLFNTQLINLTLKLAGNNMLPANKQLEWLGVNSLGIYLWHVLPILVCQQFPGTGNSWLFYIAAILLQFVFVGGYIYLLRVNFIKKYVFGL